MRVIHRREKSILTDYIWQQYNYKSPSYVLHKLQKSDRRWTHTRRVSETRLYKQIRNTNTLKVLLYIIHNFIRQEIEKSYCITIG